MRQFFNVSLQFELATVDISTEDLTLKLMQSVMVARG